MRRPVFFLCLGLISVAMTALCIGQEDPASTYRQSKFFEEEYALAKAPGFYFLINLKDKRIELKSRGMVLRSWNPQKIRFWGSPVPFRALTLTRKTALTLPQRRIIRPGEEEASPPKPQPKPGEFELEALEVKDMPRFFTLELENGTAIYVASKEKGLRKLWSSLKWHIGMPLKTLRLRKNKQPVSFIRVGFDDAREGQSLYWALTEGIKGLIWYSYQ